MSVAEELLALVRSGWRLLALETFEEERALSLLERAAEALERLREYALLRVAAESAAQNSGFSLYSAMASFKDSEERREAEKKARAKADEVIKRLDDLERQAEAGKARAGNCFGEGDYGEKVAESYALTKETIADQRKAVADGLDKMLARNKAIEVERSNFERWRAVNMEGIFNPQVR